jgi:hypothetical protein
MAFVFQPAVRLVVIVAWGERDTDGVVRGNSEVLPVVGVQAVPALSDPDDPPHLEELFYAPIVVYDGTVTAVDGPLQSDCPGTRFVTVACPWPPEEDAERLRDVTQRAKDRATEAVRHRGRKKDKVKGA